MAALALVGAVMTGCTNDDNIIGEPQQPENTNNVVTLTTTVNLDGSTATTRALNIVGVKTFAKGDKIAVVYKNTGGNTVKAESAALTSSDIQNNGKTANFSVEMTDPDRTQPVTYIYPAAMANSDGTVNYNRLANQNGIRDSIATNLDLCTYTGSWSGGGLPSNVQLVNQLVICRLFIMNSSGSNSLNNSITKLYIGDGTNGYYITAGGDHLPNPVWVAMRPVSSSQWLTFHAVGGSNKYEKEVTGKTLEAGKLYPVYVSTEQLYQGALFGTFTVNDGGSKVRFSQGNLRVTYHSDYEPFTWSFADNQQDFIGNKPGNTAINGNCNFPTYTYVDLFGYSTNSLITQWGINNATEDGYYYGPNYENEFWIHTDFVDWGQKAISNGGNTANQWRTPSIDEYNYLLNHSGATIGGTSNACYAIGKVNGVNGIFLFPDHYTHPNDVTVPVGINDEGSTGWDGNNYWTTEWSKMAIAGAVFLPATGYRHGSTFYDGWAGYWTSMMHGGDGGGDPYGGAYCIYITKTYYSVTDSWSLRLGTGLSPLSSGYFVRLVRDAN